MADVEIIAYLKSMRYADMLDSAFKVKRRYPFIRAVGAECDECLVRSLSRSPYVERVARGGRVFALDDEVSYLGNNKVISSGLTGKGVGLCVLDTGIRPHLDLCTPVSRVRAFKDILDGRDYPYDDNGHGTFVAGVAAGSGLASGGEIMGVAPECELIGVKVIGASGECTVFNVLDGMQWIIDHREEFNIRVVCASFGSTPLAYGDPLARGAEALIRNGITVVCASGNGGEGTLMSPAICAEAIAVGAVDDKDGVAPFTSTGVVNGRVKPELYADGVGVSGLSIKKAYTNMSGTSVAAPYVAGAACLILQRFPYFLPRDVKDALLLASSIKGGIRVVDLSEFG